MKAVLHLVASGIVLSGGCSSKRPARDDAAPLREDMASVPAGWFSMGCYRLPALDAEAKQLDDTADARRMWECVSEDPPRRVWLSSFQIDRFEVTNADYARCVAAGVCERAVYAGGSTPIDRELPALVEFEHAQKFCQWRGKRLPTNAEWQKAARGTDDRIYPWGDARPTCDRIHRAYVERDGFAAKLCPRRPHFHVDTERVGMHPAGASPYGVQDLLGTVKEWVSDWYALTVLAGPAAGFSFHRKTSDGNVILEFDWSSVRFPWTDPSLVDPQGPAEPGPGVQLHAAKGGLMGGISGITMGDALDKTRGGYAGFRCVRSLPGPKPPTVTPPSKHEITLPYREPGYTPPGTSTGTPQGAAKGKDNE